MLSAKAFAARAIDSSDTIVAPRSISLVYVRLIRALAANFSCENLRSVRCRHTMWPNANWRQNWLTGPRRAMIAAVFAVAGACSAGNSGNGAAALTGPTTPKDTTPKVTPSTVKLDSLNRGVYDQNNVLHFYPDSLIVTIPFRGFAVSQPFTNVIAFTSNGIVTDPFSMQGMFGTMTLASDDPTIVTFGGFCDSSGWPCIKLTGNFGRANVTVFLGGKSIVVPVIID